MPRQFTPSAGSSAILETEADQVTGLLPLGENPPQIVRSAREIPATPADRV